MTRLRPLRRRATLAAALAALLAAPVAAQAPRCVVSAIDGGDVALWNAGTWRAAAPGPLADGDAVLRTGPGSRAEVRCGSALVLTVGTGTEVNIEGLGASSRHVILQLIEGIVGLVAPAPRRGRIELRGPLAIASARSTEWLVIVGADRGTATFVRAGTVAVRPLAGPSRLRLLGPGEGIDVRPAVAPGPVVRWGAPRVAAASTALGFGWR
jgi:ferric-dicitrate binding protein FerR (iron transport regulator)